MTAYLRQIYAIVWKDLLLEFRTRERVAAMGAFAVLALVGMLVEPRLECPRRRRPVRATPRRLVEQYDDGGGRHAREKGSDGDGQSRPPRGPSKQTGHRGADGKAEARSHSHTSEGDLAKVGEVPGQVGDVGIRY